MNAAKSINFFTAILTAGILHAQSPADPPIEPVAAELGQIPEIPGAENTQFVPPDLSTPSEIPQAPPEAPIAADPGANSAPFAPLEQQKQDVKKVDEGFIIKDVCLNDLFQFLAKSAGRQYFHNSKIAGPDFLVTGHLNDGKPLEQMEELALMYGLSLHTKGNTIYSLTQAQLAQLPSAECITPGGHGTSAPGITQDRPNAPIELETGNSSP